MKHGKFRSLLSAVVLTLPAVSFAEAAYVSKNVNLRAGPATEYPSIVVLRTGVAIMVQGCLSGYQWCDVVVGPNRGWVYAGNIAYPYQGNQVPVLTYGAALGLAVVAFSVGNYWDAHYRAHPWYGQRQRWVERPHAGFAPDGHRPPARGPAWQHDDRRPLPPRAPAPRPGDHRGPPPAAVQHGDHHAPTGPQGDRHPSRDPR